MPLYEFRCLGCHKRFTLLTLSVNSQPTAICIHCQSPKVERLLSRFSSPKSEEARLASLADPDAMSGLDEQDPESLSRFMKQMGDELGEDLGDEKAEAMGPSEDPPSDLDSSDSL